MAIASELLSAYEATDFVVFDHGARSPVRSERSGFHRARQDAAPGISGDMKNHG
jgi:hypothetical protein